MKNKEIKVKFINLGKLIEQSGIYLSYALTQEGELEDNVKKVIEFEEQGDDIQDELELHYKTVKNIPYLAIDQVKLMQRMDKTLDQAALAGRSLSAFYPQIPGDFKEKLIDLAEYCAEITKLFSEAIIILYSDFSKAITITKEIELIRDKALSGSFSLEEYVFENADEQTGWKGYISTSSTMKKIMSVIESVRNAAEIVTIMTLKYL